MADTDPVATQPLFILSRVRAGNGLSAALVVDIAKDENYTLTSTVTDHPVEDGANMSDHSRPDPILIDANCVVSETPLSAADTTRALGGGAPDPRATQGIQQVKGYGKRIYDQLKTLKDSGTQLTVIGTIGRFENMVITKLGLPRNSKNFNSLEWSIGFKEVRIAQNRVTRIKVSKDTRHANKSKKGNVTTKDAPTPPPDTRSVLAKKYDNSGLNESLYDTKAP